VNVAQLRETVVDLLSASPNLIGSYILPNGSNIPAVYVVGQKSVPTEWKAIGLEVSIRQYPERLPEAGVGIVSVLQQWEVVLVQYNPDGKEIEDAMDRMVRRFPDTALRFTPGDDIAYERCRFIIPDMTIRRLYPGP
jgi:ribonucleotide monophosphatase NagD (HAD superfamily)